MYMYSFAHNRHFPWTLWRPLILLKRWCTLATWSPAADRHAALACALTPSDLKEGSIHGRWPLSWPSSDNCYRQKSFSSHTSKSYLPDCGFCKNLPRKRLRQSLGIQSSSWGTEKLMESRILGEGGLPSGSQQSNSSRHHIIQPAQLNVTPDKSSASEYASRVHDL